jgi:electron transport complex protein RnfB
MDKVYERLAAKLDELPNGFPRTGSGVELRILERIFSPEDATLALQLLPVPESAAAVARRLRRPVEELIPLLDGMVARGQIGSLKVKGEKKYVLMPFVLGIYEFQLPRMDAELAAMVEEYFPAMVGVLGGHKPALARVVPVNARIDAHAEVLPYESMRNLLAGARSFRLMNCICRTEQATLGKPCSHPIETCMAFSPEEDAYDDTLAEGFGRSITREEALAVLELAEREGLVHCTYNTKRQQMFVCNCCSCCCGFLRGVTEFAAPHLLVRSDFVAAVDADSCTSCEECAHGRCPMNAIAASDGSFAVDRERCIGCGLCTVVCPTDAISLTRRPRAERSKPAPGLVSWAFSKSVHRHGPLRGAARFGWILFEATKGAGSARKQRFGG